MLFRKDAIFGSKTLADFPLLISTNGASRYEIMSTLDFRNDQYQSLETSSWQTEDGFLQEIFSIFDAYGFEAANVLRTAKEYSSKSWKAIYDGLCELCKKPVLFFINCRPNESQDNRMNLPLTDNQESTLRFFVSCLSAAHDASTNPQRVVVVLEGWDRDLLMGEDLSGTGAYKEYHNVYDFSKFRRTL